MVFELFGVGLLQFRAALWDPKAGSRLPAERSLANRLGIYGMLSAIASMRGTARRPSGSPRVAPTLSTRVGSLTASPPTWRATAA